MNSSVITYDCTKFDDPSTLAEEDLLGDGQSSSKKDSVVKIGIWLGQFTT